MIFIDTNVFLHYLVVPTTPENQAKSAACCALFARIQSGAEEVTTSEAVLAEIVYVLSSPRQFRLSPQEINVRLKPLISLPGVKLAPKRRYLRALDIYSNFPGFDFEDALSVAYIEGDNLSAIYSYDRDFDRIQEVQRLEP